MEQYHYSIQINASADKIWYAMWSPYMYTKWTEAFSEGTFYLGNLEVDSQVQFLTPEGNGILAEIIEHIPNEKIKIKHLSTVKEFELQAIDNETNKWSGMIEAYTLVKLDEHKYELQLQFDLIKEYKDYFKETFPKAFALLKENAEELFIEVEIEVNQTIDAVWEKWTNPDHITKWYQASTDWHAPFAKNELKVEGKFTTTMASKDGQFSFDFSGQYTDVVLNKQISYTLDDGRKVIIDFYAEDDFTLISQAFEPESENTMQLQEFGWHAILESFKTYCEAELSA